MEKIGEWNYDNSELKEKWNIEAPFSDYDLLSDATEYLQLSIKDALERGKYVIKVFAIMDRRVSKRTLEKIQNVE